MRNPAAVPTAILGVALTLLVSACGTAAKDASPGGSSTSTSTGGTPTSAAQPSAAAWCAMVIDINTRGGTMINKNFVQDGVKDPVKAKAVAQESVNRRSEILAITPPEIKDAMAHELDYYAAALANPSAGLGDLTPADLQALIDFQKTECGIGGI